MGEKKKCSKCGEVKGLDEFKKGRCQCNVCVKAYNKVYIKAYRENNKDRMEACNKAYRDKNKEKIKAYNKAYNKNNKEIKKAIRGLYRENLTDGYIIRQLCKCLPKHFITPELIELKRTIILAKRELKKQKQLAV